VVVTPVDGADAAALDGVDLLVVGGPTHVHGMSRPKTRSAAADAAAKAESDLTMEPGADGPGLREWFDGLNATPPAGAAFDTRLDAPPAFTGRASKSIGKRLRKLGCELIAKPESFRVTKENHLVDDEAAYARAWGTELGRRWTAR